MEQVLSTPQSDKGDKWVTAVLDLIRLTQEDRLVWRQVSDADPTVQVYEATFAGNRLRLAVKPFESAGLSGDNTLANRLLGLLIPRHMVILTAFKPGGELLTFFPNVPPLNGLAVAVRAQTSREEDTFLQAIHNAT